MTPIPPQRDPDAVNALLTALENLVRRHRALSSDGSHQALHAELIAAEVQHELAVARSAQRRVPLRRTA